MNKEDHAFSSAGMLMAKLDYQNHPIMDGYKFCTDYSKMDEQNYPILEPYCRFLSLYRKMSYFHPKLEGYITE